MASIEEVWGLLRGARALTFTAHSEAGTGWDGAGTGSVAVSEPAPGVVVFEEAGRWQPSGRRSMAFFNVFRWSRLGEAIRLEHLRFGPASPVFLFDLAPGPDGTWREVSPHECRADCYSATMRADGDQLVVRWSVRGPRKRETIEYVYSDSGPGL